MKPFAVLLAAALWTSAAPAADPPMVTRMYPVEPFIGSVATMAPDGSGKSDMQRFYEDMGVPFPPGSIIRFEASASSIIIRNTPENIEIFEQVLRAIGVHPNQVEIDVTFVAFDLKLIEEIARKSDRAAPTGEEIKVLWREGKGKISGTSKIVTRSGVNAQSKGVDEFIYPTQFEATTCSNGVADALNAVPTSFETREVGFIQNVTPTVGPDGYTIDLTLVPELCELLDWDDVGVGLTGADGKETQAHMRVPRFHSRNLTTSIVLWDGETVIAGAMPNNEGTEITYAFISARLLDPAGQPLKKQAASGYVELPPDAKPPAAPKK
jgi:type II secretory pathway component GspD/PulD (secretin)